MWVLRMRLERRGSWRGRWSLEPYAVTPAVVALGPVWDDAAAAAFEACWRTGSAAGALALTPAVLSVRSTVAPARCARFPADGGAHTVRSRGAGAPAGLASVRLRCWRSLGQTSRPNDPADMSSRRKSRQGPSSDVAASIALALAGTRRSHGLSRRPNALLSGKHGARRVTRIGSN